MKIIERKDVDEKLWSEWCEDNAVFSPFCRLEYLDAVSDNLLFVINDNNTGGLAIPYIERFGVKTLYTPIFCRWIMWIGQNKPDNEALTQFVITRLKLADVYLENQLLNGEIDTLIYQAVDGESFKLNTQAKRKIKKASGQNWTCSWESSIEEATAIIESSLKDKFETLKDSGFPKLRKLAENFHRIDQLKIISLFDNSGELKGALLLICDGKTCLYLKGACAESVKEQGGMYFLMNEAIQFAIKNEMKFDFGGSRISGVRKFNLCFGSSDHEYYHLRWNHGPNWYSLVKKLRNRFK